jgi:rhodanese-related sulfurtransferase
LIVIVVAVGGYWLIQMTNQRQQAVSTLPAEMSVAEVSQLDREEWFILDVREQSEWNEGHIEGATLIPLGQLEARKSELPTDQKIVVVCRSGNRSAQGRDLLLKAGFAEVTSMADGMNDWVSQGLPVVTGP